VLRFFPTVQDPSDVKRFHGNNERISVANYAKSVSFYYRLIHNADLVIDFARTNNDYITNN
jgi:carboxypeptidase PM20D1